MNLCCGEIEAWQKNKEKRNNLEYIFLFSTRLDKMLNYSSLKMGASISPFLMASSFVLC